MTKLTPSTTPALLDAAGTTRAARSLTTRSANYRQDVHIALLSGLVLAARDKQSQPLTQVLAAIAGDGPTVKAASKWIANLTPYKATITPATEKDPLRVTVAFRDAKDLPEHHPRLDAASAAGIATLNSAPYYQPVKTAHDAKPAPTVADLVKAMQDRVVKLKLNARQKAALARALMTYAGTLDATVITDTARPQHDASAAVAATTITRDKAAPAAARRAARKARAIPPAMLAREIAALETTLTQ